MADYENCPTPRGATAREQGVIARMYRAGEMSRDEEVRLVLTDGLRLMLDLIEARNNRRDLEDHYDQPYEEAWPVEGAAS